MSKQFVTSLELNSSGNTLAGVFFDLLWRGWVSIRAAGLDGSLSCTIAPAKELNVTAPSELCAGPANSWSKVNPKDTIW